MSIKLALHFTVTHRTFPREKFSSQMPPPPRYHTPYIPSDLAHHEKHPTEESKSNHISQLTDLYRDCYRES